MFDTLVKIAGVIIIILSFVYILKRPDKSLMDNLMGKQKEAFEKMQEELRLQEEQEKEKEQDEPAQDK